MSEHDREQAEAQRVVAEDQRVHAEEDRVDAEAGDGGQALELGRVQAEASRVAAEALREEREDRRRIAEGGIDQHVEFNTLTGRVEAEKSRQDAALQMYWRIATLIAIPIIFISLIPATVGLVWLAHEVDARCLESQVNRQAIRVTALRSFKALGYRYDDKTGKVIAAGRPLSYYVDHPDERASQLATAIAVVKTFPPIACEKPLSLF